MSFGRQEHKNDEGNNDYINHETDPFLHIDLDDLDDPMISEHVSEKLDLMRKIEAFSVYQLASFIVWDRGIIP